MRPDVDLAANPLLFYKGLPFSASLLLILGVHEFGHYFAARSWNVKATLPYFIPEPFLMFIGTFGAVIKIKSPIPNRKALVDIGAAGPLVGFVAAIIVSVIGLSMSETVFATEAVERPSIELGDSLIFLLLSKIVVGELASDAQLYLHPVAFAGWIGLFVTALNLLPIGQLDGGHITYSLFGRWHRLISKLAIVGLVVLGFVSGWYGWFLWAFMSLFVFGRRHPPPYDSYIVLDNRRRALGYLSMGIFVVCFMPAPISIA